MEDGVRLGWLGETRRKALRALLAAEVSDWSNDWWVRRAGDEVDVREEDPQAICTSPDLPFVVVDSGGTLAFHLDSEGIGAVGRHLAAGSHEGDSGLASFLGEEALRDLAGRIRRRAGMSGCPEGTWERGPAWVGDSRLGAFAAALSLGQLRLELVIDRRLADGLIPPSTPQTISLAPRESVLERATLRAVAVMDFGEVNLAHLADLKVGEVLVGDQKLEDALPLRLDGREAVAKGFLGRQASHYAIVLGGTHSMEKQAS